MQTVEKQIIEVIVNFVDDFELSTSHEGNPKFSSSTKTLLKEAPRRSATLYGQLIQRDEIAETYNWFSSLYYLIGQLSEIVARRCQESNAPYLRELETIADILKEYREATALVIEDALRKWSRNKSSVNVGAIIWRQTSDLFWKISRKWVVRLEEIITNCKTRLWVADASEGPDNKLDWKDLNDTEKEIITALGKDRLTGERIAAKTKVKHSYQSNFKNTLSSMVKRRILGNIRGRNGGYSLKPEYYYFLESWSNHGIGQD